MNLKTIFGRLQPRRISLLIGETFQPIKLRPSQLAVLCVLLFAVAIGVRLLHWQNNPLTIDNIMTSIAARYKEEARHLINGDFASFLRGSSFHPDTGILIHTPGYPILIAGVRRFVGDSNVALRVVHIILCAASVVIVLLIAIEILPPGAALVAGLFAALSPQLSYYSLVLLPDSVAAFPILFGIYLLVRAYRHPKKLTIIGAGIAIGLSCWLRANMMLLAPFLCLVMLIWFPRAVRWRYAALLLVATVGVIAPITIRNAIFFKNFIPLSLGAGITLAEGIADYDSDKRFGLESYDHLFAQQEAGLYNRPDYANDLFRPDGIVRERLRLGRALAVIRGNKLWFIGVMVRRSLRMLTYEAVPIISTEPSVTNSLDTNHAELGWRGSPSELSAKVDGSRTSSGAESKVLQITGDAEQNEEFAFPPTKVQPNSDYVLKVPVRAGEGRMVIKIIRLDTGKTLASATVPDSIQPTADRMADLSIVPLSFVNTSADQIRIIVAKPDDDSSRHSIELGTMELYRLGSASYLWTRVPRIFVKGFQKFFKTHWMVPFALAGASLLALMRRLDALKIIGAVPLYYLLTHAPLHLELRYVLPVHYFWGMLVATSLYFISMTLWQLVRSVYISTSKMTTG